MWRPWLVFFTFLFGASGCAHGPLAYAPEDAALSLSPEFGALTGPPPVATRRLRIVTYNVHFGADVAGIAASDGEKRQDPDLAASVPAPRQPVQQRPCRREFRRTTLGEEL